MIGTPFERAPPMITLPLASIVIAVSSAPAGPVST